MKIVPITDFPTKIGDRQKERFVNKFDKYKDNHEVCLGLSIALLILGYKEQEDEQ
jgi:hypothetical protein